MIPNNAGQLSSITDFATWKAAVEERLTGLDARVARSDSGQIVVWPAGALPTGLLAANGAVLDRASYPGLFAAIGTTFNVGGESGTQFRVPNLTGSPPPVGVWAIRT